MLLVMKRKFIYWYLLFIFLSSISLAQHRTDLQKKIVLGGGIELKLPTSFGLMSQEKLAIKYPSVAHRPTEVYTNENGSVNIAFRHTSNVASSKDLPAFKQLFEGQFKQPGIDFRKSDIRDINGRHFIVMEFITQALDTKIYNLLFITDLEGTLLYSTFNCTVEKMAIWESLGKEIVSSVKVL